MSCAGGGYFSASMINLRHNAGYVELHTHSCFSLLDGVSSPENLVKQAATLGMPTLALTDHDAVYGAVAFVEAAKTHANRVADQMKPVVTEVVEAIRKNPAAFARESFHAGVSAAEGAGESLCKALSRLLKRAGDELGQRGKQSW